MKIPTNGVNQEGGIPYLSDGDDNSGDDADSPDRNGDFSEYLWMENEEEFDTQVIIGLVSYKILSIYLQSTHLCV